MSFVTSLPLTPPSKKSSQINRSISLASTAILSSSESSGTEDTAWATALQEARKAAGMFDPFAQSPASTNDGKSPPLPSPTNLASPAPLIPLFPGITTPSSAPFYVTHVRARAQDDSATFFDVFAPDIDTPSPIRLTRQLSFPALPSLPVTSMSTTWQQPQVVLEEDEGERRTPQIEHSFRLSDIRLPSSAGCSSASALGRPLGSPISLFRARNGSDASFNPSVSVLTLSESKRHSTVSCHTFGHSVEHSASLTVLYSKSPSPAISRSATPTIDAPFSTGLATSRLLPPVISPRMLRPLDDSPAVGGEKPRRRKGSGAAGAGTRSIYVHTPHAPPVPILPRPYPSFEDIKRARKNSAAKATDSPAPSSATCRSAYADVSDFDALSPTSQRSAVSHSDQNTPEIRLFSRLPKYADSPDTITDSGGSRRRYSNDPLQVVTTAFGSSDDGSPILAMAVTRPKPKAERAQGNKKARIVLPKRNASMLSLRTGAGVGPIIPGRSSSSSQDAPPPTSPSSAAPITAASSMPIPRISVSASTPLSKQPDAFSPVLSDQVVPVEEPCPEMVVTGCQDEHESIVPKATKLLKNAKLSRRKQKIPRRSPSVCPSSPPESVDVAQCSPLKRSASALSLLMKLDMGFFASTPKDGNKSRAPQVPPSPKDEPVLPIAIISRGNSILLDREEADRLEEVGGVGSVRARGRSASRAGDEEVGRVGVGVGVGVGGSSPPRKMVSMTDALVMGPDLHLIPDAAQNRQAEQQQQQQVPAIVATSSEGRKGWNPVPAALRSVKSFASMSLAGPRSPRKSSFGINVPLPTPPDERADPPSGRKKTTSNAPAKVSYGVMLDVAGALLALDGGRQRSHSANPNDVLTVPEAMLGLSASDGHDLGTSSSTQRSEQHVKSNASRHHPQAPATPPYEQEVSHQRTRTSPEQTPVNESALQLKLGPAFTTPSPAAAVRDIAWAGRPELITDSTSSSNMSAIELRRAFWNDDDERENDDRFRRTLAPESPSSGGGLTPTTSSSAQRSAKTPLRNGEVGLSKSSTMSSIRRYERDQYAWLRMQEESPTLPACDLPRSSSLGSAISTIPFPRASPGYGAPPARPRRSPLRASAKRSIGLASSALLQLQRSGSESGSGSGSGTSESDRDGRSYAMEDEEEEDNSTSDSSDPCKTPSPRSERRMVPVPMTPTSCKAAVVEADMLPLEAWLQWTG
ncbi:unnamed protein product [Tilletia controversa]|uniref:Uncharacterized protein n=2 Tax=Tilletia TaxID=13289 RepID=A0A177VDA4_9BASI|nr:hypothetical protein CF336_g356 [Tilletia laevis]KAE8263772.1 hypothetical protein A4X03_0g1430 [Tilletia caries]CAD6922762.1 unnamed protein product [Tilletia controversa]KAE8204336.1 hypothetical protein CF335_g2694 [Tilletia laevis]CAD6916222.1 unnamed protein product [Tilletia caries]